MSKVTLTFKDEFGTVSECSIEQDDFKRPEVVDWLMFTALKGIGFSDPMEGVDYSSAGEGKFVELPPSYKAENISGLAVISTPQPPYKGK